MQCTVERMLCCVLCYMLLCWYIACFLAQQVSVLVCDETLTQPADSSSCLGKGVTQPMDIFSHILATPRDGFTWKN